MKLLLFTLFIFAATLQNAALAVQYSCNVKVGVQSLKTFSLVSAGEAVKEVLLDDHYKVICSAMDEEQWLACFFAFKGRGPHGDPVFIVDGYGGGVFPVSSLRVSSLDRKMGMNYAVTCETESNEEIRHSYQCDLKHPNGTTTHFALPPSSSKEVKVRENYFLNCKNGARLQCQFNIRELSERFMINASVSLSSASQVYLQGYYMTAAGGGNDHSLRCFRE